MQADSSVSARVSSETALRPEGPPSAGGYLPIAAHGLIGDLRTAALVGREGTIDWYCPLRFDAPSIFGAIIDARRGGHWSICPAGGCWSSTQRYVPDTNVLITRFECEDGIAEIQDFMPVDGSGHALARRLVGVRGSPHLVMEVEPRFDYGRASHSVHLSDGSATFVSRALSVTLDTPLALRRSRDGVQAKFCVDEGEAIELGLAPDRPRSSGSSLEETIAFWRGWIAACGYAGRYADAIRRSVLAAKLLTHAQSGAPLIAATTSLPVQLGGAAGRNERVVSIRELASFVSVMSRLGFAAEARAAADWLAGTLGKHARLREIYALDGHAGLAEIELPLLEGYRGSGPVRIGAAGVRPAAPADVTCPAPSFWRVEALAQAGRHDEARLAFEEVLGYTNHLGLCAEAIGPGGEQLGNFPHAAPHLALLSAALTLYHSGA